MMKNKKTLSNLLVSFKFNYYILGKALADKNVLEADMEYVEKKSSAASFSLEEILLKC